MPTKARSDEHRGNAAGAQKTARTLGAPRPLYPRRMLHVDSNADVAGAAARTAPHSPRRRVWRRCRRKCHGERVRAARERREGGYRWHRGVTCTAGAPQPPPAHTVWKWVVAAGAFPGAGPGGGKTQCPCECELSGTRLTVLAAAPESFRLKLAFDPLTGAPNRPIPPPWLGHCAWGAPR